MLDKNQIFIHVPKTGGTTLNHAIFGSGLAQTTSFNYRHIVGDTMLSNSGDIFNPLKNDYYKDYKIFMMLRNPLDRLVSEYYFFKEREEFTGTMKVFPKTFEEYALRAPTDNYMISFLLGNKIYNKVRPNREDLDLILNTIESLNIVVGISEQFEKSLNLFSEKVDLKLPKKIENKRVTIKRPLLDELSKDLKKLIVRRNELDYELYNYALANLEKAKLTVNNQFSIDQNRYGYVLTYVNKHFLLELFLKDKIFLAQHKAYFNDLRSSLKDLNLKSGEEYLEVWKEAFLLALRENKSNVELQAFIVQNEHKAAISFMEAFAKWIDGLNAKDLNKINLNFSRAHIKKTTLLNKILTFFK